MKTILLLALAVSFFTTAQSAIAQNATLTTFHSFGSNSSDGVFPVGLVQGNDGSFYGTTYIGGPNYSGVVFKLMPDGTMTNLLSFDGTNGYEPIDSLIQGNDGILYGTTSMGGTNGIVAGESGTVFKITTNGTFTSLVSFNVTNGASPYGSLLQAIDGNFYGTTFSGGTYLQYGTVFKLTSDGVLSTLFSFNGTNGGHPASGLVQGSDGYMYGTTTIGGSDFAGASAGVGTVFKIDTSGTVAWSISLNETNGVYPAGGLIQAKNGILYGMTQYGGTNQTGTIFQVTTNGTFATIYNFSGLDHFDFNVDGANPEGALVEGLDGELYGVTEFGGEPIFQYGGGMGTIFKITKQGAITTLYSFGTVTNEYEKPLDGANANGLTLGMDGYLYGTTFLGGMYDNIANDGDGTVFRLNVSTLPKLMIMPTNDSFAVTWPSDSIGYGLQQNMDLTTTNWTDANLLVNDDGTNRSVIFNVPTNSIFFRLKL